MKKLVFVLLPVFAFMSLACNNGGGDTNINETEPLLPQDFENQSFDRKSAIQKLSRKVYLDCYDEIIKLNPARTSREDVEYFKEYCENQEEKYSIEIEGYDDWYIEFLLTNPNPEVEQWRLDIIEEALEK